MPEPQVSIPAPLWTDAAEDLKRRLSNSKKGKKRRGFFLRNFVYSLKDRLFIKSDVQSSRNLFFKFAESLGENVSDSYIVVQIDDDNGWERVDDDAFSNMRFSSDADDLRESILRYGIAGFRKNEEQTSTVGSLRFSLYGCSNSQVQRHCFIFRQCASVAKNEKHLLKILPGLEELERKKGTPKRVKYSGLLFSGITLTNLPKDTIVEEIESKVHNGYDFSDGPGLISLKSAKDIQKQLGLNGNCPSVFQIRYCGSILRLDGKSSGYVCKGVLLVDPTNDQSHKIQVRKSMLKIEGSREACEALGGVLGICDHSKATPGRLGQQLICLLSGIVKIEDFLSLQQSHFENIRKAHLEPFSMAWCLAMDRRRQGWFAFHQMLMNTKPLPSGSKVKVPGDYHKCVDAVEKLKHFSNPNKAQVPLAASRNLFGAVFPEQLDDLLSEGECIVCLEDGPLEVPEVMVSRSPSYFTGDVRVLRTVWLPKDHPVRKLRNCILFSTKGERPDPDKMGGGDLDGDIYLVVWNPTLLKYAEQIRSIQPTTYDNVTKHDPLSLTARMEKSSDWIHYIALADNAMLGQVESTFYRAAKEFGIDSPKIEKLNALFSSLVDRNPASLDEFAELKNSIVGGRSSSDECVWEKMAQVQLDYVSTMRTNPKENQSSASRQSSFLQFHQAIIELSTQGKSFETMILKEHKHHFLASLQKSEVAKSMTAWAFQATGESIAPPHPSQLPESSPIEQTVVIEELPEPDFEILETEARSLRKQLMATILKEEMSPKAIFQKQSLLRDNILARKDAVVRPLENRIEELDACEKSVMAKKSAQVENWYRLNAGEVSTPYYDDMKSLANEEARLKADITERRQRLSAIVSEINGWWLTPSFLSASKSEKIQRRNELEIEIAHVENSYKGTKNAIIGRQRMHNDFLQAQKAHTKAKIREYEKRLENFCFEKESAENKIKKLGENFDVELSGKRWKLVEIAKSQVTELQQLVASLQKMLREIQSKDKQIHNLADGLFIDVAKQNSPRSRDGIPRVDESSSKNIKKSEGATKSKPTKLGKKESLRQKLCRDLPVMQKMVAERKAKEEQVAAAFRRSESLRVNLERIEKFERDLNESDMNAFRLETFAEIPADTCNGVHLNNTQNHFYRIEGDLSSAINDIDQVKRRIKDNQKRVDDLRRLRRADSRETDNNEESLAESRVLAAEKDLKTVVQKSENEMSALQRSLYSFFTGYISQLQLFATANQTMHRACLLVAKECSGVVLGMEDRCFCPEAFMQSEEKLKEVEERKRSLGIGVERIEREISKRKISWEARVGFNSEKERCTEWKEVLKFIRRVIRIEEDRFLGCLRNGKRPGQLPVYKKRAELQRLLSCSQVVVVTAGTGCGKSSQLPQYIADDFGSYCGREDIDRSGRICCTQPRRVAAQKIAKRVAEEYRTNVGDLVGFRVGSRGRSFEESVQASEKTVIEFVTEGWLLFKVAKSKDLSFLDRYDCIIIDEMHERNAEQDLCLSLLRDYLRTKGKLRPSFKVVVMSASIDPKKFCSYFDDCPTMDCPGRLFPVKETYAPCALSIDENEGAQNAIVPHAVRVLFDEIVYQKDQIDGDVLIFLSGAREIDACVSAIRGKASEAGLSIAAYPLYSQLEQDSINAATDPAHRDVSGRRNMGSPVRKVICATNIAETSLTIDGVRFVIDSGLARKVTYEHSIRCPTLSEESISRASSIQRRGRAGRTSSGRCYYLYSKSHHEQMTAYDRPKILERPVDELILFSLSVCNKSIEEMGLLDSPSELDVRNAKERLLDLDMVCTDADGLKLTESGKLASALSSFRPESIRMVLQACEKFPLISHRAVKLATIMSSDESVFADQRDIHEEDRVSNLYSDHLLAMEHLEWYEDYSKRLIKGKASSLKKKCEERGVDFRVLKNLHDDSERCHQELKKRKLLSTLRLEDSKPNVDIDQSEDQDLLCCLISGYFHRIVNCLDPSFIKQCGCISLENNQMRLFLDRNSGLHEALTSVRTDEVLNDDASDGEEDAVSILSSGSYADDDASDRLREREWSKEQISPSFLLYGGLYCFKNKSDGFKKLFMLDASAIEGSWISDNAPLRWRERVTFEPGKMNLVRVTKKHIGAKILSELGKGKDDFFEKVKHESKVHEVLTDYSMGMVRIVGSQVSVSRAVSVIQSRLSSIVRDWCKGDLVEHYTTRLKFSTGMEVNSLISSPKPSSINQMFGGYGINEIDSVTSNNFVSFLVNVKKQAIVVFPKQGCDLRVMKICFSSIKDFDFEVKPDRDAIGIKFDMQGVPQSMRHGEWKETAKKVATAIATHAAFEGSDISSDSFPSKDIRICHTFDAICREASSSSSFWNELCSSIDSKNASCRFIPSQKTISFIGSGHKKAADGLKRKIKSMSSSIKSHKINLPSPFMRFQVRRYVAILGEVRRRCPKAIFFICGVEQSSAVISADGAPFPNDYTWLSAIAVKASVESIDLSFAALKPTELTKAQHVLNESLNETKFLPITPIVGENPKQRQSEKKACVLCRRSVKISFHKKDRPGESKPSDTIDGSRLSLCGCSYCRECFRNSAKECLEDDSLQQRRVSCRNCREIVTAKDCRAIFSPKKFPEEWNDICRLAEANYCETNMIQLSRTLKASGRDRQQGWATCPDCGCSLVHGRGYLFVFCRNVKCNNKICTRCYQVVTCQEDAEQCAYNFCSPPSRLSH